MCPGPAVDKHTGPWVRLTLDIVSVRIECTPIGDAPVPVAEGGNFQTSLLSGTSVNGCRIIPASGKSALTRSNRLA
jgi:hypothetical protein